MAFRFEGTVQTLKLRKSRDVPNYKGQGESIGKVLGRLAWH